MPLRITSPQTKVVFVVLGYIAALTVAVVGALLLNVSAGLFAYGAVVLVLVLVGARTFRGEAEDVHASRPMWRMTTKPVAGFVIAALFFLQALTTAASAADAPHYAPLYVLSIVFSLALSAAYLNSSLRLRRIV
ncbi:hypothetical protein [uncultured Leifsonia sp.]|uniref:hypothetical protein n=1 Tax=uncultured Leifsonia sp. TaxID=340359 RepID=UPI0025EFE009|nr:hypothetical protein [uncultured Leifsonia sp.]